jgi:hypothetical protein
MVARSNEENGLKRAFPKGRVLFPVVCVARRSNTLSILVSRALTPGKNNSCKCKIIYDSGHYHAGSDVL